MAVGTGNIKLSKNETPIKERSACLCRASCLMRSYQRSIKENLKIMAPHSGKIFTKPE